MRIFFVPGLLLLFTLGAEGQARPSSFAPAQMVPSRPVLPQHAAPFGSVPTFNPSIRPFGGFAPPTFSGTGNVHRSRHTSAAPRYIGPVYYVPNAFDSAAAYDYAPAEDPGTAPPRRLIVNQYFLTDRSGNASANTPTGDAETTPYRSTSEDQVNPGDLIGPVQNYYLIAYKDHTIYPALAYWVEGETLHYVTTQNTHNQASLPLIDIDQTTKLNSDRAVPFSLSGK